MLVKRIMLTLVLAVVTIDIVFAKTVAYWQFNEGQGQSLSNSQGSSTMVLDRGITADIDDNDPDWVAEGILGSALGFAKNSGYKTGSTASSSGLFTNEDFASLNLSTFTLEAFFKLNSLPASSWSAESPYYIIDFADKSSYHNYAIRLVGKSVQYFQQSSTGAYETVTLDTTGTDVDLLTGRFYGVSVTRDDSNGMTSILLVDTVTGLTGSVSGVTSTPTVFDIGGSANPYLAISAEIGGGSFFQRTFDGVIDEVRISDDILSVDEMLHSTAVCQGLIERGQVIAGDLDGDCKVDQADLAGFSGQWMECNNPGDSGCADVLEIFETMSDPVLSFSFEDESGIAGLETGIESPIKGRYIVLDGGVLYPELALDPAVGIPFTFSMWLKINYFPDGGAGVWDDNTPMTAFTLTDSSNDDKLMVRIKGRLFQIAYSDGGQWDSVDGKTVLASGEWIHLAVSYDGGNMRLVVNGYEECVRTVVLDKSWDKLWIGRYGSVRPLVGNVDEIKIYNQSYSVEQVQVVNMIDDEVKTFEESATVDIWSGYEPLQVESGVIHPLQDQLTAWATVVPWTSADAVDLLLVGVTNYFGSRTAVHYSLGSDASVTGAMSSIPVYDTGHTRTELVGEEFQCIDKVGGMFDLAAVGEGTQYGDQCLVYYKNTGSVGNPSFGTPSALYVDGQTVRTALGQSFSGWLIEDVDGDGVEDLLVTGFTKADPQQYWPDNEPMWDGTENVNSGPGKGYDVQGVWLGTPTTTELFWAKGQRDGSQNLSFTNLKKVYYRVTGFGVQWRSYETERAIGLIEVQGQKYLLHTGSVDKILAMPVGNINGDIYCGSAVSVLNNGTDSVMGDFFAGKVTVCDIDKDGNDEILIDGNLGRVAVLKGSVMGQFVEAGTLFMKGGYVSVDTLATPCRADWDGDGYGDLIVGDSAGWLTFWPGTADSKKYGEPVFMTSEGVTIHQQAGLSGSIQGINEHRWGYVQPTVGDWDEDGELEIITNNIKGEIMLYERSANPHDLAGAVQFSKGGMPLAAAWRSRPAIINSSYDFKNVAKPCLLYLDWDGDMAVAAPESVGSTAIESSYKMYYNTGEVVHLCGPEGFWGRTKMAVADWDEDGDWDVLFGTNGSSHKYFLENAPNGKATPFFVENVGNSRNPVFAKPVLITLADGAIIDLRVHNASVWPTDLDADGHLDLIIGAEDGKVYSFMRSNLKW